MMKPSGTVLILASAASEWRGAVTALSGQRGYRVLHVKTEADARSAIADVHVDVLLAEDREEGGAALDFFGELRNSDPDIIRILILAPEGAVSRRALSEAGIYQFLRKPVDPQQLALAVEWGLERRELMRRQRLLACDFTQSEGWLEFPAGTAPQLPRDRRNFEKLVYVSEAMGALCDLGRAAASTDQPMLIRGETGTGKELLARALHFHSARSGQPFVVQNCGAMTDTFLQVELFGHEKGAFAITSPDRAGLIRGAHGGTLFLDEIGEISRPLQSALLRFLQTGEVKAIGSDRPEVCDVRILVGSSQPLAAMVEAGDFRQDLYFRLRSFELDIPPLRERPEDIPTLAEFFTSKHGAAMGRKILGISANALERLAAYDFPGNVRELENEIRRMVALAKDGTYLTSRLMSPAVLAASSRKSPPRGGAFSLDGKTLKDKIEGLEKHAVREALARHKWNRSRVAEELGLSRVGLANKIRRYGLNEQNGSSD
jgi:two-component system, NtrC family, response regulator HupR/HoxA